MASTIVTKNSSTASAVPVAGDLTKGELAVNVTDKKLYTKDNGGSVVKLVGGLGNQEANAVAITGGAIDGTTVGSTTAAAGAFTTLAASSTVSGTGFSNYLASPPAIGGTAAAAGSFTTLAASGNFSLSGGTANGVLYLNGSKVATSGSALTFDGTTLGNSGGFLTISRPSGVANTQITLTNNGAGASGFQLGQSAQQQQFFIYDSGAAKDRYIINSAGEHLWLGASEQMRLTSTGLGIGTTSPTTKLYVEGTVSARSGSTGIQIYGTGGSGEINSVGANPLIFNINSSEKARIDFSGNLTVGATVTGAFQNVNSFYYLASNAYGGVSHVSGTASGSEYFNFSYNAGVIGSITQNGTTAVAYNTSSDYRLKNIDGPLTGSGAFIDALKPKVGTWKADGSKFVGFLAHEVQEVSPNSVVGQKDAVDADGKPIMQAMEYGSAEFIANIIAELQSLRARVAALES